MFKAASKILLIALAASMVIMMLPYASATTYYYRFFGPFIEGSANEFPNNATVIVHYRGGGTYNITGNHDFNFASSSIIDYFTFCYTFASGEETHEYWLTEADRTTSLTPYLWLPMSFSGEATPVVFNIRALGGIDVSGVVSAANGEILEQKPIDDNNIVVLNLTPYNNYAITIESVAGTEYTFNNINVYTSPVILTVSSMSFPPSILLQYKYLHIWASRPSSTEIQISYEDTNEQTENVVYTLMFENGTTAFTNGYTDTNSFVDLWSGASSNQTYYLEATVTQTEFGSLTFAQILLRDGSSTSPIDLSFLGDWPIDPTQIFWAFVIFIIFGCFSVLNAYVGGFAGVFSAIILTWLGWIEIPQGSIVAAVCIVIMAAIIYWKRRG